MTSVVLFVCLFNHSLKNRLQRTQTGDRHSLLEQIRQVLKGRIKQSTLRVEEKNWISNIQENWQDRKSKGSEEKEKRSESGGGWDSSLVSDLGDWLADAVIQTEIKVSEEDCGYGWVASSWRYVMNVMVRFRARCHQGTGCGSGVCEWAQSQEVV